MTESLIFLTEPDTARRDTIAGILHRIPRTTTRVFDTLSETRRAMRADMPRLMIGPWSQGGETMIAVRAAIAGNAGCKAVPQMLILTSGVSSSRISLTKEAGSAELIPCDPLDEKGLFNRLTLLLCGPDALYESLTTDSLSDALEHMPALRRRLAA